MRRPILLASALLAVWVAIPASAQESPVNQSPVVLVTKTVGLATTPGGEVTAKVTLINTTTAPIGLSVSGGTGNPEGCTFTVVPDDLPAALQTTVTVTASSCRTDPASLAFSLTAGTGTPLTFTARPSAPPPPDWGLLGRPFAAAAGVALVLVLALYAKSNATRKQVVPFDDSYDYKKSWVSNITVVVAAFTGVVGSDKVAKAVVGDDATNAVAVMTVASALAVVVIAFAPLLVLAFTRDMKLPVWTLLAGGFLTLAGAVGELGTAVLVGVDAADQDRWVLAIGTAGILVLLVYAWRTLEAKLAESRDAGATDKLATSGERSVAIL